MTISPSKISYEATGQFFSSSHSSSPAGVSPRGGNSPASVSPRLLPRSATDPPTTAEEEDLISFSDDDEPETSSSLQPTLTNGSAISRKTAPPLPSKPARLRSTSSTKTPTLNDTTSPGALPSPPKSAPFATTRGPSSPQSSRPRPPVPPKRASTLTHRLKPLDRRSYASSSYSRDSSLERGSYRAAVRKKVGEVYGLLPSPAAYLNGARSRASSPARSRPASLHEDRDVDALDGGGSGGGSGSGGGGGGGGAAVGGSGHARLRADQRPQAEPAKRKKPPPPLPPRRALSSYPVAAAQYAGSKLWSAGSGDAGSAGGSGGSGMAGALAPPVAGNRKEDMWRRRLARARQLLQGSGVSLRVWRVGDDLMDESVALVQKAQVSD